MPTSRNHRPPLFATLAGWLGLATVCIVGGCGTTRQRSATQQLLLSDAVDRSVSDIDFRPMAGKKVYFDGQYLRPVKGEGFVNAEYITSSLRQQIVAAGCLLMEHKDDAEIVIEARVGTLGTDAHNTLYGIPASNALASAAQVLPQAPPIPAIPEIALARRDTEEAAAKIAAFAYDVKTRQPIWQSGMSRSLSTSRDTWVLGVGPFQAGSIRDGTRLAGSDLRVGADEESWFAEGSEKRPPVDYERPVRFADGWPSGPEYPPRSTRTPAVPGEGDTEIASNATGEAASDPANPPPAGEAAAPEGAPRPGAPAAGVANKADPEQMLR